MQGKSSFRVQLQPFIVRIYKFAGMISLIAILLGLAGYLAVNLFYLMSNSWVRPVVLSPNHEKVVQAQAAHAEAKVRALQARVDKASLALELAEIDRVVASSKAFLADTRAVVPQGPITDAQAAVVRRQVDEAMLAAEHAESRRALVQQQQAAIEARIVETDTFVTRFAASPYLRASEQKMVIGFVPYRNMEHVKPGEPIYSCVWGLVRCAQVGKVVSVIEGEVTDMHPHDNSVQRGKMIELSLSAPDAEGSPVMFLGSKPLWVF